LFCCSFIAMSSLIVLHYRRHHRREIQSRHQPPSRCAGDETVSACHIIFVSLQFHTSELELHR
jgi:hypothetical protein